MRYFVTLDTKEFSFTLPGSGVAQRTVLQPTDGAGTQHEVELLSRGVTGRAAVVLVDGHVFRVHGAGLRSNPGGTRAVVNGRAVSVAIESELERRARPTRQRAAASGARVAAPMPGRVVKVSVRVGDVVARGAGLLSIEAMKMENEVQAPCDGRVARLSIEAGATVEADQELLAIEPVGEVPV